MGLRSLIRTSSTLRIGLIVLGITAAFVAGASHLVYPSPLSPLVVGAGIAGLAAGVAWLRKPVWALYAAMFVVLLPIRLIPPQVHSMLNRSLTVIAVGAWLFDVITRRRRVLWTSTALLMVSFVTWSIVTLLWTENLSTGMTAVPTYVLRLLLYLVLIPNEIRTQQDLDGLMNTLALNGWLLVLVSAGTVLLEGYTPGTRLEVLGVNANELGIVTLVTVPGVLWGGIRTSGRRKVAGTLLGFMYILLTLILVALSGSRGSAISWLIALLAFWLWRPTRPWGRIGMIILVLAVVSAPFIFSTLAARFAVEQGDTLLGGREAIWKAAWLLILDHPWRGVGIGNAPYAVMPQLRILRSVGEYEWAAIHNPLLTIWAETGVPGLLLYLGVLVSAVWLFVRRYLYVRSMRARSAVPYFALISSAFAAYMLSWIKGGGMESGFTYFLMLALLLIPSHLDSESLEVG